MEYVVLVDADDRSIGKMEKMQAHEEGKLHRAFSIFIFNKEGKLLLHKRAATKYHSPNLWTNTCCSHPRWEETLEAATNRRLMEEMGMACEMEKAFHFTYRAVLDQGLTEHELDHVFIGSTDTLPVPNPEEVGEFAYVDLETLRTDIENNPGNYTEWLKIALPGVLDYLKSNG